MIRSLIHKIERRWARSSSARYIAWLRKQGVRIGSNVVFHWMDNIHVDTTRPCMVSIGNNVHFAKGLTILTHGYDWVVLLNRHGEMLASSGPVTLGNNIFVGFNVTILKGVTIGDNCIIGAESVVTRDIPANSVAVGNPAHVICTMDQYHEKRKAAQLKEAAAYVQKIRENLGREPRVSDFWEEFPLFMSGEGDELGLPVRGQLGPFYDSFKQHHKAPFASFEAFIQACNGIISEHLCPDVHRHSLHERIRSRSFL